MMMMMMMNISLGHVTSPKVHVHTTTMHCSHTQLCTLCTCWGLTETIWYSAILPPLFTLILHRADVFISEDMHKRSSKWLQDRCRSESASREKLVQPSDEHNSWLKLCARTVCSLTVHFIRNTFPIYHCTTVCLPHISVFSTFYITAHFLNHLHMVVTCNAFLFFYRCVLSKGISCLLTCLGWSVVLCQRSVDVQQTTLFHNCAAVSHVLYLS